MKLSCFVVFILLGSTVFSLSFQGVDGPKWVEHLLTGLPGGQLGFLIVVNILIFFLAFFLDFFELSFIVIPLIGPVADKLGIDLVWFGVLLAVNMQTSFMHPPFGFALFYLRSVAPHDDYTDRVTSKRLAQGDHRADLLGCGAVRPDPGPHGRPDHRVSRTWCRADWPRRPRSTSRRSSIEAPPDSYSGEKCSSQPMPRHRRACPVARARRRRTQ